MDFSLLSPLEIFVELKNVEEPGKTFTDTLQDQKYFLVLELVEVFVLPGFFNCGI